MEIIKQTDMKKLLDVQKEIGTLSKNSKNPFFKSQYLDLNDLLTHVQPILNAHDLILAQPILNGKVTTQILDAETGMIIAWSEMELPQITDPQKIGSCVTYFRRYTLKSLLAISETDDDGNLASKVNYTEVLTSAKSLGELAAKWKSLPGDEKLKLAELKEELKSKLS